MKNAFSITLSFLLGFGLMSLSASTARAATHPDTAYESTLPSSVWKLAGTDVSLHSHEYACDSKLAGDHLVAMMTGGLSSFIHQTFQGVSKALSGSTHPMKYHLMETLDDIGCGDYADKKIDPKYDAIDDKMESTIKQEAVSSIQLLERKHLPDSTAQPASSAARRNAGKAY